MRRDSRREVMTFANQARGCRDKIAYTSKAIADGAIRVLTQKGRAKTPELLNSYKCKACRKWHVGNDRSKQRTWH